MSFSLILNITILSYHPQVIKMGEKHKGHVHVMLCVIYCTQILICLQDLPLECVCKKLLKNIPFLWEKLCEVPVPSHLSNQACISRTMEYYVVGQCISGAWHVLQTSLIYYVIKCRQSRDCSSNSYAIHSV